MKLVSIIIVSYNTQDLTLECIESIYKFENPKHFEIIVVDNGSGDGSVKKIKDKFPEVRLIENSENLGFAKANNQGIKASRGEW